MKYANVMSTVAVFVALGGSSIAAVSLSRNSVRTEHIRPGAVKRSDIAARAVDSRRVKNRSLRAIDFARGTLRTGATGPAGPQGTPGLPGAKGETGSVDTSQFFTKDESDARFLASNALIGQERLAPAQGWTTVNENTGSGTPEPALNRIEGLACTESYTYYEPVDGDYNPVGFYRDPYGTVHLRGAIATPGGGPNSCTKDLFQLPLGYRPAHREIHVVPYSDAGGAYTGDTSVVEVGYDEDLTLTHHAEGLVTITGPQPASGWLSLDGITFRCAPSGANGCP